MSNIDSHCEVLSSHFSSVLTQSIKIHPHLAWSHFSEESNQFDHPFPSAPVHLKFIANTRYDTGKTGSLPQII